jgi:IS30 family transposase
MPQSQLNKDERWRICHLTLAGWKPAQIARALGRHRATIGRELARNRGSTSRNNLGCMKGYFPHDAQAKAHARRAAANAGRAKIADNPLGNYVRAALEACWSPQQIAGRLQRDHPDQHAMRISHEAVYQWVYRQGRAGIPWHRHLRRAHARRRPRIGRQSRVEKPFRGAVGIAQRPAVVAERSRLGDWESDTVMGGRNCRVALATHLERKSRLLVIRKIKDKRAATFTHASIKALRLLPPQQRLTLTADNGSEFARFATLQKKLGLSVYFAEPYKAWQRGANENANGLIRQFFPKGTDLRPVTHQQVARIERLLNNRPRKCLDYQTPAEVFAIPTDVALRE